MFMCMCLIVSDIETYTKEVAVAPENDVTTQVVCE